MEKFLIALIFLLVLILAILIFFLFKGRMFLLELIENIESIRTDLENLDFVKSFDFNEKMFSLSNKFDLLDKTFKELQILNREKELNPYQKMQKEGMSKEEIAKKMRKSVREIELLLKMN